MENKHTPGPIEVWGKQEQTKISGFYIIGPKDEQVHAGTAYVASYHDAVLYAAASDMLQSLTRISNMNDIATIREEALAAIKKAQPHE